MSGKNSKTPVALGLLTTIFLFCPNQLAFQRINWLFHESIGFSTNQIGFSPHQLAFQQINWLFNASIGFFSTNQLAFPRIKLAFFNASLDYYPTLKPIITPNSYSTLKPILTRLLNQFLLDT